MRFEILIHGKPSEAEMISLGQIRTGIEEQIYKEFFGSNLKPSVPSCFVYEIRKWKGTLYSIYSVYRDGKDSFGSGNGYCVVSLIVESYFSEDYNRINDLLARIYDSLITNNVIDESGKYLVRKLKGNIDLIVLNRTVEDLIGTMQFTPIDGNESFGRPSDNPICLNFKDANPQSVYSGLREQGRVYVSSKYKSFEQLERERIQRQAGSELTSKPIIKKLQNNNSERSSVENIDAKSIHSLSQKIDLLLHRLPAEMSGGFPFSKTSATESHTNQVKNSFKDISIFNWITLVNCVLLLLCLFRCNTNTNTGDNNNNGDSPVVVTDSIKASGKETKTNGEEELSKLQKENEALKQIVEVVKEGPGISIDIDGIKQRKIKSGKPYKLTLQTSKQIVPIPLDFRCSDGLTISSSEDGNYLIYGTETGKKYISCYIGDYLLIDREITVE